MKTDDLEYIARLILCRAHFNHFIGEHVDIDYTENPVILVNNGECKKPVHGEYLHGYQHSGGIGKFHQTGDHDIRKKPVPRCCEEPACRYYSEKMLFLIDNIKIDDPFADAFFENKIERLRYCHTPVKERYIGTHVLAHRLLKKCRGHFHRYSLL